MSGSLPHRCVRSWDGQSVSFAHPAGRPPHEWSYADGRMVMAALVRDLFGADPPPFHITFELAQDREGREIRERCFIIKTDRGTVTLDPLDVTYEGAFGMSSVFAEQDSAIKHDHPRSA